MSIRPHSLFFVGIGGIGMSGLARYFRQQGARVAGYDRTPSALTDQLRAEGIDVQFDEDPELIPVDLRQAAKEVLVVRTPAVPASSPLLAFWNEQGARMLKRSEVLGMITEDRRTIAVAGTHGKTTVSTMVAHLLRHGGKRVNAFLGGISANYGTNVLLDAQAELNVVEADEYDRSFLRLHPSEAIITAMDPDHLDIYGTPEAMVASYNEFAALCTGRILVHERASAALLQGQRTSYAIGGKSVPRAEEVRVENGAYHFDLVTERGTLRDLRLGMPGRHNVENATAAAAMAQYIGVDDARLREGLASFTGVERRFQTIVSNTHMVYVDDYAHHPAELEATIRSARELYPDRHLTGIFQPHLFTRTRDFAPGFANSLALLDTLYLLDIYPAREEPIPGITSEWLLQQVPMQDKHLLAREEVLRRIVEARIEVLLTLGAGDIDRLVPRIAELLQHQAA
ncbi:MAG: UDP-N-acetylmuramate--L-alanine ligase [Flavobacteriales bacterium]|nr:UDP-N-acetylmuramate--L-alanine ligase [Flavobacteriales bacterium]